MPVQARVVSAVTATEAAAEFTLYTVEVTPSDGGEPWTVQHRFKCAPRGSNSCVLILTAGVAEPLEGVMMAQSLLGDGPLQHGVLAVACSEQQRQVAAAGPAGCAAS